MFKAIPPRRALMLAALAMAGMAGGVAVAAIPDSTGTIHGCYRTSGGVLRVIDTGAGESCRSGETGLDWNQQGPPGTAFDPRAIVERSDESFFDPDFSFTSAFARCNPDERPISGGHRVPPHVELRRSQMESNGWAILVDRPNPNVDPGPITAFVYCAPVPD